MCKILCVAGPIGLSHRQPDDPRGELESRLSFVPAATQGGFQVSGGQPGGDLVRWAASRLRPTQLHDQATTGITTSEETGIQLKDNTSTLSAVLPRAVSQLGVLEKIGRLSSPLRSPTAWANSQRVKSDGVNQPSVPVLHHRRRERDRPAERKQDSGRQFSPTGRLHLLPRRSDRLA